ncbi:GNAT family N-acetyltransferase [Paenibacillus sp. JX-17]|uniref:GNAT family N-acetyltransferase n=1 Tax=Paenibacillus lacisoli TaxID=3064525 RepID=A0ABT9C8S8_9BACL|nr:GNAT family N-acetyltransferase [Paenibacillus sp. JX-17]MDO7905659.1 GNAT family N-acetyltransferase [Paenibacillus sp. JX-17]
MEQAESGVMLTLDRLDSDLWPAARRIYEQSFDSGRKGEAVLQRMFTRGLSQLHLYDSSDGGSLTVPDAMAITGMSNKGKALVIDYLAVKPEQRGQGIGQVFVKKLIQWARENEHIEAIVIEVEYGEDTGYLKRRGFWERCGFQPTSYIHEYIWVPEPYQAMVLPLQGDRAEYHDGKELFRYITSFHGACFTK